jgi:hypothetical protein
VRVIQRLFEKQKVAAGEPIRDNCKPSFLRD